MLFIDNLPVELVALELPLLELSVAPGLERAEALVEAAGAAAIEPDRGAGQIGEQPLVMADERQRRGGPWGRPPPSHSIATRSRWLVGSSSSRISGSGLKILTNAVRRASPPDRRPGSVSGSIPSSAIMVRAA